MSRLLVWAPDAPTVLLPQIHDAQRQRVVRPDDGEVGAVLPGEGEEAGQVFRAQVNALDGRAVLRQAFAGDAGIAGRAPHLRNMGRLRQFPNQCVLAPAGADDEDFHGRD